VVFVLRAAVDFRQVSQKWQFSQPGVKYADIYEVYVYNYLIILYINVNEADF
jgi:hypothetical protein